MDHFTRLKQKTALLIALGIVSGSTVAVSVFYALIETDLPVLYSAILVLFATVLVGLSVGRLLSGTLLEPLHTLWQGILHVSPSGGQEPAPNLDNVKFGRELAKNLMLEVYQLASQSQGNGQGEALKKAEVQSISIVSHLPLPLFAFNKEQHVTSVSDASLSFLGIQGTDILGKPLHETVRMEFPNSHTLEAWAKDCEENKVTDYTFWEKVRVFTGGDGKTFRYCDIAAQYNRDNSSGTEFIVAFFDKTDSYKQNDTEMNFVALAVHELRTPLTMLRGYIEVLQEEISKDLDPEMQDYLQKMQFAAKQLTTFVNNILNVSRIDDNALMLHLNEEDWPATLTNIVKDMQLKASLYGVEMDLAINGTLPKVGIDKTSIYEVVNNLVDNAIKYRGSSKKIQISTELGDDGFVNTTVRDYGVGIPSNIIPNLFEKFYRNHRTKSQIGGTGLGLYLVKSFVEAHGGKVWVSSKEGQGATFGFSLVPYDQIDKESAGNKEITRTAHGWIKNHSLYRR